MSFHLADKSPSSFVRFIAKLFLLVGWLDFIYK